jgi:hypothetical protein
MCAAAKHTPADVPVQLPTSNVLFRYDDLRRTIRVVPKRGRQFLCVRQLKPLGSPSRRGVARSALGGGDEDRGRRRDDYAVVGRGADRGLRTSVMLLTARRPLCFYRHSSLKRRRKGCCAGWRRWKNDHSRGRRAASPVRPKDAPRVERFSEPPDSSRPDSSLCCKRCLKAVV